MNIDAVLKHFGTDESKKLGAGGEATVYALDAERVLRLYNHPCADLDGLLARNRFLDSLNQHKGAFPYELPAVLDCGMAGIDENRCYTIEKRIVGRSMMDELVDSVGSQRHDLIRSYMDAAEAVGMIQLESDFYGELCRGDAIQVGSVREFMMRRVGESIDGSAFPELSPDEIVDGLGNLVAPDQTSGLVHLDYFPGNVMAEDGRVTAVIDWGYSALWADVRLTPLVAAIYLYPRISPTATLADQAVGLEWLRERDLERFFEPMRRWVAAYWLFVQDDPSVVAWCEEIFGM